MIDRNEGRVPGFVWSVRRGVFHKGTCRSASVIRPKNFQRGEGRPVDRRGCLVCKPGVPVREN